MNRRHITILTVFAFMGLYSLSAYDVNRTELDAVRDKHVRFVSYVGPHSKIETLAQIREIGRSLGRTIAEGGTEASWYGRYDLDHLTPGALGDKLEADIFSMSSAAEVDDIRNLRLILTGYLEEAYGYSESDAALLAEFISIYNAVYRGVPEYFRNRYIDRVVAELDPLRAGLSNLYSDWPGGTQMVIPLTASAAKGSLNTLDTGVISDVAVTGVLRKQEDMGVELRKDMVDLKERQVDEAEETIEIRKDGIAAEWERITEEKRQTAERLEKLTEEKTLVLSTAPEPGRDDRIAAIDANAADLKKREERLAAEEASAVKQAGELEEAGRKLEEKKEEIRAEREQIAADQKSLLNATAEPEVVRQEKPSTVVLKEQPVASQPPVASSGRIPASGKAIFFRLVDSSGSVPSGQLVVLDVGSGSVRTVSELNSVLGRTFVPFDGKVLVIAGRSDRGGSVRTFLLDPGTLMTIAEGTNEIFPSSVIVPVGNTFLAVTGSGNSWRLGLFDSSLSLLKTTDQAIDPYTAMTVDGEKVFLQAQNGDILTVGIGDLKLIR